MNRVYCGLYLRTLQFLSFCIKECDVIRWAELCICQTCTTTLCVSSCGVENSKKQTYEQRSVCVPFIFTVVYHQLPVLIHLAFRNSTGIEISKSPSSHGNTSTKQLARAVVIAELSFARCLFLCRREFYYFVLG